MKHGEDYDIVISNEKVLIFVLPADKSKTAKIVKNVYFLSSYVMMRMQLKTR